MKKLHIVLAAAALSAGLCASAQESPRTAILRSGAANLSREYRFSEAADALREVLSQLEDSAARPAVAQLISEAENGLNMSRFCSNPVPLAKGTFSLGDFFLHLPLEDRAWRSLPTPLDSVGGAPVEAVYAPESADEIYFTAPGEGGRDIFRTTRLGEVWSAPEAVLPLRGDEIYPLLSPDGKTLWFASKGLFGMGGYDLYVSHLEDGGWSEPENLGIPYSSPEDDLLFYSDGTRSFLVSNRGCEGDKVTVYVLEYDALPVRRELSSPAALRELSRLETAGRASRADEPADPRVRKYMDSVRDIARLKKDIDEASGAYESLGGKAGSGADLKGGQAAIEKRMADLEQELAARMRQLGDLETELLLDGISVNPEEAQASEDGEPGYEFVSRKLGGPLKISMLPPEPKEDFHLSIGPEGRFVTDNTLPSGLVYQIQFLTLSKQATVAQLKGVGPVFWRKNGAYISHYAGLLRSYDEALEAQALVRKAGFPKAFIVALSDGKAVTLAQARNLEKASRQLCQIRIRPADGKALSEKERSVISALTGKDLARVTEDGEVSYLIGPFEDLREAELSATGLRAGGIASAEVEKINN